MSQGFIDTYCRGAYPSIVKETLRSPRNDPLGERESGGLSEKRSDQVHLMVSSLRPARPLVVSAPMVTPTGTAERYCAVQQRKECNSERRPSFARLLAADDQTYESDGKRP